MSEAKQENHACLEILQRKINRTSSNSVSIALRDVFDEVKSRHFDNSAPQPREVCRIHQDLDLLCTPDCIGRVSA